MRPVDRYLKDMERLTRKIRAAVPRSDHMQTIIAEQQEHIDGLQALTDEMRALFPPEPEPPEPPTDQTIVHTTAELLAALEVGGVIELAAEAGEFFHPTGFIVRSHTSILAPHGGTLRADNQPAIWVKPGVTDVLLEGMRCLSGWTGGVIQLGNNDTYQVTPESVPQRIIVRNVCIPTHRGKRGIEINAGTVTIENCVIEDVYSTAGQDSQAICILNSPGNIDIRGGVYAAGSENIMLGGDSMKVPGQVITDVVIRDARLYKPVAWRTDGIKHGVKNLLELKAGRNVSVINCTLDGCWKDAQDGWAIMITPKNSQFVENVTIEDCEILNAGGGVNLLGEDYNSVTPQPTTGVRIHRTDFVVSKAASGGRGILALITGGMQACEFVGVTFDGDGNCIVQADSNVVQGPCDIRDGNIEYLQYGVMMPGSNYGDPIDPNSSYYPRRLEITFTGNTFRGSPHSHFKTNFPDNVYP